MTAITKEFKDSMLNACTKLYNEYAPYADVNDWAKEQADLYKELLDIVNKTEVEA